LIAIIEELGHNELRIFRAVYEKGPISRVRLARGLNLTRAAVTIQIQHLSELGLIIEVGKGSSSERRGRREVLLTVNPDAGIIMAVHISLTYINYGLVNLNGRIIEKDRQYFPAESDPESILTPVLDSLQKMLNRHCHDDDRIFGISVAIPGIINYTTGIISEKSRPGWNGFNLKQFFEQKLHLKVFIENDVKALTLGEFHLGTGRNVNDMVCLWSKDGIGSGIIHDGRLLRGYTSSAGEIGFNEFVLELPLHKTILINGRPNYWGDILSITNIRETIGRGIAEGWTTKLSKDSSIEKFIDAYNQDDPLAIYIFNLLSRVIGTICCNLIYSYNPKVLVLAGPLFEQIPLLRDDVKRHLDKGYLRTPLDAVDLKTSVLGEDGILIGCAALHLEYIFRAGEHTTLKEDVTEL